MTDRHLLRLKEAVKEFVKLLIENIKNKTIKAVFSNETILNLKDNGLNGYKLQIISLDSNDDDELPSFKLSSKFKDSL
jgi:hypothetical protein